MKSIEKTTNSFTINKLTMEDISTMLNLPIDTLKKLKIGTIHDLVEKYCEMKDAEQAFQTMLRQLK